MIKVLHILTDTNIGGAGRLLVNYLHCFDREKFHIKVILPVQLTIAIIHWYDECCVVYIKNR